LGGGNYEEISYEGYGPGGVAVLLDIMTDNRNRTAGEIRHLFARFGGNLGETGCVAWMFEKKGLIVIDKSESALEEDALMLLALDAGAEDFKSEEDTYEVTATPGELAGVKEALEQGGVKIEEAEVTMLPQTEVKLSGPEAEQMLRLMDALEEHDDIQNVYANFDL